MERNYYYWKLESYQKISKIVTIVKRERNTILRTFNTFLIELKSSTNFCSSKTNEGITWLFQSIDFIDIQV